MNPLCELCVEARAVVYCKCDSARLCFSCDTSAHAANPLSRRHSRWLICDKCLSQPAIIRCMDDKMSVCQGCDDCNRNVCLGLGHRRMMLMSYTGCPPLADICRIWPFAFDYTSGGLGLAYSWGSFNSLPKSQIQCLVQLDDNDASFGDKSSKLKSCAKYEPEMAQSSILQKNPNFMLYCRDQTVFLPQGSDIQPKGCYDAKDIGISEANDLCEGLNMDGVQLNLDGANEIFDCSQDAAGYQVEDGGLDCLLMEKNISVTEPNGLFQNAMEASSPVVQQGCVGFQSSREVGSGSMIQGNTNCVLMDTSCNAKMNLGFPPQGQVHSSIPLSLPTMNCYGNTTTTGFQDCATSEFQDCGLSPPLLPVDTPWESNLTSSCPQAREKAKVRYFQKKKTRTFGKQIRYVSRKARADTRKRVKVFVPWEDLFSKVKYFEKKKTRTFGKQIRYASRKARADTGKRVKGRFVKAEEEYDSD